MQTDKISHSSGPNHALSAATALTTLPNRQPTGVDFRNSSIVRESVSSDNYVARNNPPVQPPSATKVGFNPIVTSIGQNIVTVKPTPLEYGKINTTLTRQHQPQQLSQNVIRSEIEQAILDSKEPLRHLNSNEIINTGGYKGMYLNKREADFYRGPIPIEQFRINPDPNPEIIRKKMENKVQMTQEIAVRYLNPPPLPKPGDLIIREKESSNSNVVAPPLIIRQEGARSDTPPPRIYREAPLPLPPQIPEQVMYFLIKEN